MPGRERAHYRGDYQARARAVRDLANSDAATTCWRCGELARAGDPWQAGHLVDGQVDGVLMPEHASCNASHGSRLRRRVLRTSERWF